MSKFDDSSDLVLKLYEAAQDTSRLPTFLEAIAQQFAAHTVTMRVHDSGHSGLRYLGTHGMSAEEIVRRESPYADRNPWRSRGFRDMLTRGVGHDGTLMPRQELVRTEFYNEVLKPVDVEYGMGICLHSAPPDQAVVISINRSSGPGSFTEHDVRFAESMLPHFRNAYSIMRRLSWMEMQASSLVEAIDRLHVGLMFVDRKARCVYRNEIARLCLDGDKGINLSASQVLSCSDPLLNRQLADALHKASLGSLLAPQRIYIASNQGAPDMVLVVAMQRGGIVSSVHGEDSCACLFIHQAKREPDRPEVQLQAAFQLTRAEARLAISLAAGNDLKECAELWNLSMHTVRAQLRAIFAKTNTHRQSQLVSAVEFVLRA